VAFRKNADVEVARGLLGDTRNNPASPTEKAH